MRTVYSNQIVAVISLGSMSEQRLGARTGDAQKIIVFVESFKNKESE